MDLLIKKADKNELENAIALSKKYCYKNTPDRGHGFTINPIDESYLGSAYVAKIGNKVIGAACASDFSKKEFERYNVDDNLLCKEIGKVTVDEEYRGMNVASTMLKFILAQFPNVNFYATIMEKPVENKASKALFESLGFKCYKITNLFHKSVNLNEESIREENFFWD